MATLTLRFKNKDLKRYRFNKGTSLTVGRSNDNQIRIDNLAVSGHHAKIDAVGEGFLLTDLMSKNGTFVNSQLTTSHWLKDGDIINIAKHTLVFKYEEGEAPQEELASMSQTMVMDTQSYRSMIAKRENSSGEDPTEKKPGVLSYLTGGNGEIKLNKKLIKVGKNKSSDIVVSGLLVGRTSFTISKRPNGYYLSFVGGFSKPKVNGSSVKTAVQLKEFDTIEIGSSKFQFLEKI
jgi:pSer/pThr/pTyr-binding forkhead associated (FHA) protein